MIEAIAVVEAFAIIAIVILDRAERKDLLDRIMARDWSAYQFGRSQGPVEFDPKFVSDEDEAEIWKQSVEAAERSIATEGAV